MWLDVSGVLIMNIVPIPKRLLPDTIKVRVPKDGDFGGEYEKPVTIAHVRWCPVSTLKNNAYALADGAQGRIFVDVRNSAGFFSVPLGSLVSINGGEELSVLKVDAHYVENGFLHHIEMDVG